MVITSTDIKVNRLYNDHESADTVLEWNCAALQLSNLCKWKTSWTHFCIT